MNMRTEDLLEFCAYYTLLKSAARLPLTNVPKRNDQNDQSKPKQTKMGRKKMQIFQNKKPEKTVKPKIQQVTRTKQKKSVSPIEKIHFKEGMPTNNKNYDLNYFMSHMSDHSFGQNHNQTPYRPQQYEKGSFYNKKLESPSQNYDTFSRSGVREFQTFEQKVRRENNKYTASAINNSSAPRQGNFNAPRQSNLLTYSMTQQVKNHNQNNSWLYGNQTVKKSYIVQSQKIPFVVPNKQYNQPYQSKLNYSPSARNYSPVAASNLSGSWMRNSPINESNLSKSRSKHQRKKSEKPFYDASKLTLKVENEPNREAMEDQSLLSQSFVSINENGQMLTNTKKQMAEQNKRETSTTAPSRMYSKAQPRNQKHEIDLDDNLYQTLSELQRQPPIALQVKIKSMQN